jgi:hypothetical protein
MLRTGIHGRDTFALPLYMKRALFDLGGEREPEALSPPLGLLVPAKMWITRDVARGRALKGG